MQLKKLMIIPLFNAGTAWKWAVLPAFQRKNAAFFMIDVVSLFIQVTFKETLDEHFSKDMTSFFHLVLILTIVLPFDVVQLAVLCVRLGSNIISLCQVTSLTISSPVVWLLPLASGRAFNSISFVNGGIVILP
jgi:hypothetical protein